MIDREKWFAWEGEDVEGRLAGVWSLFVAACPNDKAVEDVRLLAANYPHVLWGTSFLKAHGFALPLERNGQLQTLEVDLEVLRVMPAALLENDTNHVILRLSAPEAKLLKRTDTIRLDFGNLDVMNAMVQSFTRHEPQDYNIDKVVLHV